MVETYKNDRGMKCYRGVTLDTPMTALTFASVPDQHEDDKQWALHTNIGTITVLNRMTGFGHRDVETGYRDSEGKFWLASGSYDIRWFDLKTVGDAIERIKSEANTCVGD